MRKTLIKPLSSLFILGLILLLLAAGGCQKEKPTKKKAANSAHPSSFISAAELARCLATAQALDKEPEESEQQSEEQSGRQSDVFNSKIIGGIVPHHLVAGPLIAGFMEKLAASKPEVIILAGPNHNNVGAKVITGYYDWQTPAGLVKTDASIVKGLLDKGLASRDEEIMSGEHSVGAVMPFIRCFLPEARVVPLIFHHDVSLKEIDALLNELKPVLEEGAVVLGSVDFSHYLTRREAQEKDALTLKTMNSFDYAALYRMGNDHLDSPASLSLVFREAQRRGIKVFQVLENTNSGIILKNDLIETTSYFTLFFKE